MKDFADLIKDFNRMCWHYRRDCNCAQCPLGGSNISQCRKTAFEEPVRFAATVDQWVKENPKPVYPTWGEWLLEQGIVSIYRDYPNIRCCCIVNYEEMNKQMPEEIAKKLGLEPKEAR